MTTAEDGTHPPPLSILHVDAERGFSGGEVQVFLLLEGLRARGHRVALACPAGSRGEEEARARGFDVHTVPLRNDLDLRSVRALARTLRTGDFDLVHLHTGRATWLGGLAAELSGVPAVTTRRMDRRVKRGARTRLIYGRLVRRAAAISPSVAAGLREAGVAADRIRTIPSTVDPARVRAHSPEARARLRAELLDPDDGAAVCVLALAALVPRKGLDVLLDALACLESGSRPMLWIAGDGPERGALEERARARDLGPRTRFLGRRDDVADLLAAADVLALPSHKEGLGVAALEGMAAGLPILASRVGGLADAVQDGRTGVLLPPGDVAAWADGLRRLAADAALRERLGAAGPSRVAEGFLPEQMTAAYEALYFEVLEELGRAPLAIWRSSLGTEGRMEDRIGSG